MAIKHVAVAVALLAWPSQVAAQGLERASTAVPEDVRVARDIPYATYGARVLLLDLYEPTGRSAEPLPSVVVITGGSWRYGDKEGFGPIAAALAARGLVAVSIEYRTSQEALFPAAVHDVKAAVRWLRANAAEYGLDPEAIGTIGGSAGAHLATYLGVTPHLPELEGSGGNEGHSSAVAAVVGLATPAYFSMEADSVSEFLGASRAEEPELWEFGAPINHVGASSPPLLLIHSETDSLVPFERSLRMAERYGEANVPVEVVLIPAAPHAFWNFRSWFAETMDRSAAFFWRHFHR